MKLLIILLLHSAGWGLIYLVLFAFSRQDLISNWLILPYLVGGFICLLADGVSNGGRP